MRSRIPGGPLERFLSSRVGLIPKGFEVGTVHDGRVTRLRMTTGRGGQPVASAVFVNFGARREGLMRGIDMVKGLTTGDAIKVRVGEIRWGDHGEIQFELDLEEKISSASPAATQVPQRVSAASRYEDNFKGVTRIGNYVVVAATSLPEAKTPGAGGLPGLASDVLWVNQRDKLTDFEVTGEMGGARYRLMLTEELEQLAGDLEEGKEIELRIQFSKENEVYFSFPNLPAFIVGQAMISGGTTPKAGELIKCRLKPREWAENELFSELFFGRLLFEDVIPTVKGKLRWILDVGRADTYMADTLPHLPNEQPQAIAVVPTILLSGAQEGQEIDLVRVDDQYNAYPKDKKVLAEILWQMFNEGGEIEAVPVREAHAVFLGRGSELGCFADIYWKGEKQLTWILIKPHVHWFEWLPKGEETRVKVQISYRGQKDLPFDKFIAELSRDHFCFVLNEAWD